MVRKIGTKISALGAQDALSIYLTTLLVLSLVFGVLIYITSEYFEVARFSQLVSFRGADGPGPLPKALYPDPMGVHFFGDFLIPFRFAQQPNPYFAQGFVPFAYLPVSAVMLAPLVHMSYWTALACFFAIGLVAFLYASYRIVQLSNSRLAFKKILVVLVISGPMMSMLDRANVSLWMTAICVVAVIELRSGRSMSSSVLFGLAAAMKAYPILFLVIFMNRREWKCLGVGLVTFLVTTCIPLAMYPGGLRRNGAEMIDQFINSGSIAHASRIRAYNSSFYALFDSIGLRGTWFTEHYLAFAGSVGGLILIIVLVARASEFETLLATTCLMVFVPQTVGQYVLLLFLVPLVWILTNPQSIQPIYVISVVMIGVLMTPKGLPLGAIGSFWSPSVVTYTSVVNPALGLFLSAIAITSAIGKSVAKSRVITS